MSQFVRFTSRETGGELFLRKDMIAAVGSYWKGVTHVTLVNEDIDFEVKESVRDALRLITGENYEKSPLTVATDCDTMRGRKDKPCKHHKFRSGTGSDDSSSLKTLGSRPPPPACAGGPSTANATAETKS